MTETPVSDPPRIGWFRRRSAALRQRSFPREFRVEPPSWPRELETALRRIREHAAELEERRAGLKAQQDAVHAQRAADRDRVPDDPDHRPGSRGQPLPSPEDEALADAAIGVWRTQRKLDRSVDEVGSSAGPLRRHLAVAWKGLAKLEVTIQTHDGEEFDSGTWLDPMAIQPHPGLTRETIIETVQPTVYRSGRAIRMGQVVVGRPETESDQ